MPSKYWIKLYHEILDDPKMGQMPEVLFARCIKLFLIAGDFNEEGLLPPINDIAWRLRIDKEILEKDILELQKLGILIQVDGNWIVKKFSERQGAMSPAEKMRLYREDQKEQEYYDKHYQGVTEGVTDSVTNSNTDTDTDKIRKDTDKIGVVSSLYEQEIGSLTPMIAEQIKDWVENYSHSWIEDAIKIAVENNKRKVVYINGILRNWKIDGRDRKKSTEKGHFAGVFIGPDDE